LALAATAVALTALHAGSASAAGGAGLIGVVAVLARPRHDPGRWLRGADGERATATMLDRLPGRRWVVLHDRRVPGSRANLDHLVVGPTGVWVVDSKACRGAVRARRRSRWMGERRLATGAAAWEAEVVGDRLGISVTPIVAVHGGALARRGRRCHGVRVLPAGAVVRRLRRGRRVLDRAQVRAFAERADRLFPPVCR